MAIATAYESYSTPISTTDDVEITQTTAVGTVGNSQTWTFAFDVKASANSIARVRACFQPMTSGAAANGSEVTGTLTNVTTAWQRVSVSGATPGSSNSRAQVIARFQNAAATSVTVYVRNAKFAQEATASGFTVGDETVAMEPTTAGFATILPVYNPSEASAPCSFTIAAPDASSAITDVYMAIRSSRRVTGDKALTDFLNGPFYARADASANGWTVTLGTNVTDGGTYADINHATDPTAYSKKVTWTRTTLLDSLRGEHDVWARVKAEGAELFTMQLRWGPNGGSVMPYVLPEVTHDTSSATSFGWVMKKLGRIRIPEPTSVTLGTLTLELWTHVGTADQDLDVEYLLFMPADEQSHIAVSSEASTQTWVGGHDIVTPVTNPGGGTAGVNQPTNDITYFDDTTDNAGTSPAGGSIVGAGTHRSTWTLSVSTGTVVTMLLRVRNITDSSDTLTSTVYVPYGVSTHTLTWTAVAGKTYQLQVDDPSVVGASITPAIISITDSFTPSLVQNGQLRTDPGSVPTRYTVEQLNSSSVLVGEAGAGNVPFVVPPGLSLVQFMVLDAPLVNYDEPESAASRTITVTPTIYPRYPV